MVLIQRVLIILCVFLVTTTWGTSYNPQERMVGARHAALGSTNPAIPGDTNGLFINPATLGAVESMPLTLSHKKLLGEFDYRVLNTVIPLNLRLKLRKRNERLQRIILGFSLGTYTLSGIPKTDNIGGLNNDDYFVQTGSYSGGTQIGALSMGTAFYDWIGFHTISMGSSLKYVRQYLSGGIDSGSTMGIDTGIIASRHSGWHIVDNIDLGLSIHNVISPPIKFETENKQELPLKIYAGIKADLFDEALSLYSNNGIDGAVFGAEYMLQNSIILRGSSNFKTFRLGTGIILDKIAAGFNDRDYGIRFDYTYEHYKFPISEPTHMFSISILGDSRPNAPRILSPEKDRSIIGKSTINLSGIGPKNTTIRLFNNGVMIRTTATNKLGKWQYKNVHLNPEKNLIYVQSYSLNKDLSLQSYPVIVYSDIIPPTLDIQVIPHTDTTKIILDINEDISKIEGRLHTQPLSFVREKQDVVSQDPIDAYVQPTRWTAEIKTPVELKPNSRVNNQMITLFLQASDLAGNKTPPQEIPLFLNVVFPQDKYVHYQETLRIIGKISPIVTTLKIDNHPIYIDSSRQFAAPIELTLGKNTINFKLTLDSNKTQSSKDDEAPTVLTHTMRVLRLKSYPDVTPKTKGRREIEFLSTIEGIDGDDDGNFYPNEPVTRAYITKIMVLATEASIPNTIESRLFSDVPIDHSYAKYIKVAIENGLIFSFPDRTFRPDQALTLSEALFLLSTAGVIENTEIDDTQDSYVTRAQLAEFLAYTPEYEQEIEDLINWKVGY